MQTIAHQLLGSHLAHQILAYLAEHPLAQDTLEGIMEWWLLDREIVYQTTAVRSALAELVANGLILETRTKDSHAHYRLNPNKVGEVLEILRAAKRSSEEPPFDAPRKRSLAQSKNSETELNHQETKATEDRR
jgi:DNA-binding transcriptional regulator PaaX